MAEIKTKQNDASVEDFLNSVENAKKKEFAFTILDFMKEITKDEPKMWGDSIVGFGCYHYKYESGREGDMLQIGFSPRKQSMTLYIMHGLKDAENLLSQLGKHKTSKACLYINKQEDIDLKILKKVIKHAVKNIKNKR